jgi:4-hydroxy-3-polyprenylbenzoate decarboxylase
MKKTPFLVAITGASGSIYALKYLELLSRREMEIHLIISDMGKKVIIHEIGHSGLDTILSLSNVIYEPDQIWAKPASGSTSWRSMTIIPCSMGTLGAIASGISANLIHRAADCCMKERKRLVLVIRETPLNRIHMENMLRAHEAGAVIFPAMPAFYNHPSTLEEMADLMVHRVGKMAGLEDAVTDQVSWKGKLA